MIPVKTPYSNVVFRAEGCNDLPGTMVTNADDVSEVETCWELSDEELEQINRDRRVYLYTLGSSVPPMLLTTESRFTAEDTTK